MRCFSTLRKAVPLRTTWMTKFMKWKQKMLLLHAMPVTRTGTRLPALIVPFPEIQPTSANWNHILIWEHWLASDVKIGTMSQKSAVILKPLQNVFSQLLTLIQRPIHVPHANRALFSTQPQLNVSHVLKVNSIIQKHWNVSHVPKVKPTI
jgi:hypothetical protein